MWKRKIGKSKEELEEEVYKREGGGGSQESCPPWRLDPDGLEEPGVPERQLHHLLQGGQLLPAPADVVVTDGVQGVLLRREQILFVVDTKSKVTQIQLAPRPPS